MGDVNLSWLESLLKSGADAYSTVKQADALKAQSAPVDNGMFTPANTAAGLSMQSIVLIGGAVLLVIFLKD